MSESVIRDTPAGIEIRTEGLEPITVQLLAVSGSGTHLLVGTEHDGVMIRVTAQGRKIETSKTHLRPADLEG